MMKNNPILTEYVYIILLDYAKPTASPSMKGQQMGIRCALYRSEIKIAAPYAGHAQVTEINSINTVEFKWRAEIATGKIELRRMSDQYGQYSCREWKH